MEQITLKEFKKKHRYNPLAKECKTEEEFQAFRQEVLDLTKGGAYECVYEFAQMEGCDMDDVYDFIR